MEDPVDVNALILKTNNLKVKIVIKFDTNSKCNGRGRKAERMQVANNMYDRGGQQKQCKLKLLFAMTNNACSVCCFRI